MIDKIKKIKEYRSWALLLNTLNITDNHDKYIKYLKQHSKYDMEKGIINDIDGKSTLPEAGRVLSKIIDINKIHIVNSDDKEICDYNFSINKNNGIPLNYIINHISHAMMNEMIDTLNNYIEIGNDIYINQLFSSINVKDKYVFVSSKFYTLMNIKQH